MQEQVLSPAAKKARATVTNRLTRTYGTAKTAFELIQQTQKAYSESGVPVSSQKAKNLYAKLEKAQKAYIKAFEAYATAHAEWRNYFIPV